MSCLVVTMQREVLRGVSTWEGVAAACGHSTEHSTGRRRRVGELTAEWNPQSAAHSPLWKSTPRYTIGCSTPAKRGRWVYTPVRAGVGFSWSPPGWRGRQGQEGWAEEGLGESWQKNGCSVGLWVFLCVSQMSNNRLTQGRHHLNKNIFGIMETKQWLLEWDSFLFSLLFAAVLRCELFKFHLSTFET